MHRLDENAFFGPRAGLLLGRADLMDRIGARANMLGTEARPSIIASFLETLRNYTDEQGQQLFSEWLERHKRLWEMAVPYMGESLRYGAYDGVYLALRLHAAGHGQGGDRRDGSCPGGRQHRLVMVACAGSDGEKGIPG